jgi:hypothetical protein
MKTNRFIPAAVFATAALIAPSAFAQNAAPTPAPNEVVYTPTLPTPTELVNGASSQGVKVTKVDQSNGQVVVTYAYPNGQVNTVAYQVLPSGGSAPAPSSPAPAVAAAGTSTVVYQTAPAYYAGPAYYPGYTYGYPGYWPLYPAAVGIGIGLGFHGGWGYHGWGGGFRGGWHR